MIVFIVAYKYQMKNYDPDNFYHKIYFETNSEFECLREVCLNEGNWLSHNFTKERLKLEDHFGFSVVFSKKTDEPVVWGGVFNDGRFPNQVARMCNRFYTFPDWRLQSQEGLIKGWNLANKHIIEPLIEINDYDCYFMGMQTRTKKSSKGYFRVWVETLRAVNPKWTMHDEYLQTVPYNNQKCWQNFMYLEVREDSFKNWNPLTINQEVWDSLEIGVD
jgi:hypothetical protein